MSKQKYKVEYDCDCGCDYGNCHRKNVLLFEYNASVSNGRLFIINHYGDDSEIDGYISLSDNSINALFDILTMKKESSWNNTDKKMVDNIDAFSDMMYKFANGFNDPEK